VSDDVEVAKISEKSGYSQNRVRGLIPIQPGVAFNPGGRPKTLRDVRKLARKMSMDALHALIGVYTLPNGKLDRQADGKVVVAAAQTVLTWAYGKPPDADWDGEQRRESLDLSGLSLAQRKSLLSTLAEITTVDGADELEDDGPEFDPTRFSSEPVTIEPDPVDVEFPGPVLFPRKARTVTGQKKARRRKKPRKRVLKPRVPKPTP
jgi:hypothetical protein